MVSPAVVANLPALYGALERLVHCLQAVEGACRAQADALQQLDAEAVQQRTTAMQERLAELDQAEAERRLSLQQVCRELGVPEPATQSQLRDCLPETERPRFIHLVGALQDGVIGAKAAMDLSRALSEQALSFTAMQVQALPRGRRRRLNSRV